MKNIIEGPWPKVADMEAIAEQERTKANRESALIIPLRRKTRETLGRRTSVNTAIISRQGKRATETPKASIIAYPKVTGPETDTFNSLMEILRSITGLGLAAWCEKHGLDADTAKKAQIKMGEMKKIFSEFSDFTRNNRLIPEHMQRLCDLKPEILVRNLLDAKRKLIQEHPSFYLALIMTVEKESQKTS